MKRKKAGGGAHQALKKALFSKMGKGLFPWLFLGGLVGAGGALVYFSRPWLAFPISLLGAYQGVKIGKRAREKEEKIRSQEDFAKFLELFASFLEAGYNPERSLLLTGESLEKRWEEKEPEERSSFMEGLSKALLSFNEGKNFDQILIEFSRNFPQRFFFSFVKHLILGKRQGADLAALSLNFYQILMDQKELREERETRLYSAKREGILLFIMPFILLALVRWTGLVGSRGGFLEGAVKIFFLFLFYLAWKWSQKILEDQGLLENPMG